MFVVHFHATNLSDFDDELVIVTDVGAFPVTNLFPLSSPLFR